MSRDTQKNQFLRLLYDLYDCMKFPKNEDIIIETKRGKGLLGFFHKKIEKKNIQLEIVQERLENFRRSLILNPPDFDLLWDFCELIRVAEKIFFYNNSPDNTIFVECEIGNNDSDKRKFSIKIRKNNGSCIGELRFILEKDVFGKNIISINVVRDYGLKMENVYKIVDKDTPYNDSSDLYLINEINFILKQCILNTFLEIESYIRRDD